MDGVDGARVVGGLDGGHFDQTQRSLGLSYTPDLLGHFSFLKGKSPDMPGLVLRPAFPG